MNGEPSADRLENMNTSTRQQKLTALCGLLGAAIVIAGCVATALPYAGEKGEAYSLLNHFISELGIVGVSKLAEVFNMSLIAAGLIIAVFMAGLGRHLQTRLAHAAAVSGAGAGILCSMVGCVPMNDLVPHLWVAFSFFSCGLLTVGLFSHVIARDPEHKLPRWLVIPALMTFGSFAAFLAYPVVTWQTPIEMIRVSQTARPDIWAATILEWLVLITVTTWIALVSVCLWARRDGRTQR